MGGNSSSATEGYVEAFDVTNAVWSGICDANFDILDAHVICTMMGFNTAIIALASSTADDLYGIAPSGSNFVLDNLDCSGLENSVFQCPLTGELSDNCEATQIAGVNCSASKLCLLQKTSLKIWLLRLYFKKWIKIGMLVQGARLVLDIAP